MTVHFPPVSALRAVESAERHRSFRGAAEELHVTPSAISHQIKHAEELWGLQLFERRGRRLVVTKAGHALTPVVRDFLRRITSTLEELKEPDTFKPLRVTLLQSFAFKWLVPRLGHFNTQHPEIEVWISTTDTLIDFDMHGADAAIRLGYGDWGDLYEELLLREYVFPVCSPRFMRQYKPKKPEDLLRLPLLRRDQVDICPRWRDWFHAAGVHVQEVPHGSKFPQTSLAVQAAIDDQGLALARSAHVHDDIKAGRLIHLFPHIRCDSFVAYYFVCMHGRENEPQVAAFHDWLKREAAESQREFDAMVAPRKKK